MPMRPATRTARRRTPRTSASGSRARGSVRAWPQTQGRFWRASDRPIARRRAGHPALRVFAVEDQRWPKRCGHTGVKEVMGRGEALARLRAAVDARDQGADILILARTDARSAEGLDEAIWRLRAFADLGANILFLEAPRDETEMAGACQEMPGIHMANMLEEGLTPILPPYRLEQLGYRIAAYPLTLLATAVQAMGEALTELAAGRTPGRRVGVLALKQILGFSEYDRLLATYEGAEVAEGAGAVAPGREPL